MVAIITLSNVNVANPQLAHVPSMNTKTITSAWGDMSKTISKTMNMTRSNIGKIMNYCRTLINVVLNWSRTKDLHSSNIYQIVTSCKSVDGRSNFYIPFTSYHILYGNNFVSTFFLRLLASICRQFYPYVSNLT